MSKKEDLEKKKKIEKLKKMSSDAQFERQVEEKYGDISPVMSKGNFSSDTPKDNWKNTGITQEDVDKKKRKK